MSREKTKKQKQNKYQIIQPEIVNISKEQMVEIQAEAYYIALKRIEEEKNKVVDQKPEKSKYKWYENILFILNFILWPWKINKRFRVGSRAYDSVPVIFVSFILHVMGVLLWMASLCELVRELCYLFIIGTFHEIILKGPLVLALLVYGSILIVAGKEFEKETDSNKIYAYSASIIALISCVVSIIALLKGVW